MAIMFDAVVPPQELTAFARLVPLDQSYVLNTILPDEQVDSLDIEFATEVTTTTRAARAREFDAPPAVGRRDGFETRKVRIPAVSQMLGMGELDRLQVERMRQGGNSTAAIEAAIFDDTENNVRSILARSEIMRGSLLTTGTVEFPEMGGMTADFRVPDEHFVEPAVLWTDHANADILGDLRPWNRLYRASNGFGLGGMIVSEDTLYDMLQNEAIRDYWANAAGAIGVVTIEQLNQTLVANRCPQVKMVYDAQVVGHDSEEPISILDPKKVIFTPPDGIELGRTRWGMSATALELSGADVEVEGSPAGIVAVMDKADTPPFRQAAYADSTVLPYLRRPKGLMVATVAEDDG